MLNKGRGALSKREKPVNISFHFKDLSVTEGLPTCNDERERSASCPENNSHAVSRTNLVTGGDDTGGRKIAPQTQNKFTRINSPVQPSKITEDSSASKPEWPKQKPVTFIEDPLLKSDWNRNIRKEICGREKAPSPNFTSALRSTHVEDHPLAVCASSSDSDNSNFDEEATSGSRVRNPARTERSPTSENYSRDRAITKDMLSNALFDSKARTQLLTTLKKNIQNYTSSTARGDRGTEIPNVDSDVAVGRVNALEPLLTHVQELPPAIYKSDSVKDTKTEELLHVNKHSPESCSKEAQQSDLGFNIRSPKSTSMYISSPRSTTGSMSLSTLLADDDDDNDMDTQTPNPTTPDNNDIQDQTERKIQTETGSPDAEPISETSMALSEQYGEPCKSGQIEGNREKINQLPSKYLLYLMSVFAYLYITLPLPAPVHVALSSFLVGVICATVALCLFVPAKKQPLVLKPPYVTQTVPHRIPVSVFNPKEAFKGWMNEIEMYDIDTYHISATHSVFVTLDGSTLRLQMPRRNIPKRATFGERNIQVTNVIQQRLYDLSNAKVYLQPTDLVKKRVWSKKYPICIEISNSVGNQGFKGTAEKTRHLLSDDTYDVISEEDLVERIYLFGRTQRQKEEWFYRFQRAINLVQKKSMSKSSSLEQQSDTERKSQLLDDEGAESFDFIKIFQEYYVYITRLLPDPTAYKTVVLNHSQIRPSKPGLDLQDSGTIVFSMLANKSDEKPEVVTSQPNSVALDNSTRSDLELDVAWFNVVVGRIMFDFLRLRKWADWMSNKIQKKLEKIRLPYFMEGLRLTDMDLGRSVPIVQKISLPKLDSQGIWIEMDIAYNGSVQMTLETKMVLTRLGKRSNHHHQKSRLEKSAVTNSEEEDSAESSDADESSFASSLPTSLQNSVLLGGQNVAFSGNKIRVPTAKGISNPQEPSGPAQEKRWVRIVDSITKSKYFQKVTETTYVKKKLETVSNTPLMLTAELHQCQGTICVNIPPPPSDRIWYGFKDHPHMLIKARPQLGERAVTVAPITDWIEKKLIQEFNKVLLMPNMDDIPMPLMFNNLPTKP